MIINLLNLFILYPHFFINEHNLINELVISSNFIPYVKKQMEIPGTGIIPIIEVKVNFFHYLNEEKRKLIINMHENRLRTMYPDFFENVKSLIYFVEETDKSSNLILRIAYVSKFNNLAALTLFDALLLQKFTVAWLSKILMLIALKKYPENAPNALDILLSSILFGELRFSPKLKNKEFFDLFFEASDYILKLHVYNMLGWILPMVSDTVDTLLIKKTQKPIKTFLFTIYLKPKNLNKSHKMDHIEYLEGVPKIEVKEFSDLPKVLTGVPANQFSDYELLKKILFKIRLPKYFSIFWSHCYISSYFTKNK